MPFHPMPIDQQVIVVTGASSGIGLATARMAAERRAKVVLVARSGDVLARERQSIEAAGGRAIDVVADVGSREAVQAVAHRAIEAFGGFDTWVNVAGVTMYGNLWDVSDADSERLMRTNFWGTVNGCLAAVSHLRQRGGTIVNVGSVASEVAFPLQGMYCASKHAVQGFTDALRMELIQAGLPVALTLVKPASIDTPIPERARNLMARQPSLPPPLYRPEEVANAILHAAVHPNRDIYVGGAARAIAAFRAVAPSLYDRLAPAISAFESRNEPPRAPSGVLHHPGAAGEVRGDYPGPVMPVSLYTRAALHPLNASVVAAALTAAAAAVILNRRRRG